MALQRLFFRFAYRVGRPRWDTGITPPELVEVVEGPGALPPGRALDLGCGTGTNVLYLAAHGWEATGVDFIPTAIEQARLTARRAALEARFVRGDVSRLAELGVWGPFDLVVDIGCFHAVPASGREGYARGVAGVTRPGATLMMFEFAHLPSSWRFGGSGGAPEAELRRWLGEAFSMVEVRPGTEPRPGAALRPSWYRMVRR